MAAMTHYSRGSLGLGGDRFARNFAIDSDRMAPFNPQADRDYARSLSKLIESEIIPRLMAVHAGDPRAPLPEMIEPIDAGEIAAFAPLVMQIDADALLAHVEAILDRGVSVET